MILLEKIKNWINDEYWLWHDEIPRMFDEILKLIKSLFKSGRIILWILFFLMILSLLFSNNFYTLYLFILFFIYYRDRRKRIGEWKGNQRIIKKYNLKVSFFRNIINSIKGLFKKNE